MLIDCKDTQLINFLDNKLDGIDIEYTKKWISKYNKYVIYDYEPFCPEEFEIKYECKSFKELHYLNKIAKDFIKKREYLERCLCLK